MPAADGLSERTEYANYHTSIYDMHAASADKVRIVVTEREALIAMNRIAGLGAITVKRMAERFGSLASVFTAARISALSHTPELRAV